MDQTQEDITFVINTSLGKFTVRAMKKCNHKCYKSGCHNQCVEQAGWVHRCHCQLH